MCNVFGEMSASGRDPFFLEEDEMMEISRELLRNKLQERYKEKIRRHRAQSLEIAGFLVGVRRFELRASASRTRRSTKLSHTPMYSIFRSVYGQNCGQTHFGTRFAISKNARQRRVTRAFGSLGLARIKSVSRSRTKRDTKLRHTPYFFIIYVIFG